jgi:hypothetical protein
MGTLHNITLAYGMKTGWGGYFSLEKSGARIIEITEEPYEVRTWIRYEDGTVSDQLDSQHSPELALPLLQCCDSDRPFMSGWRMVAFISGWTATAMGVLMCALFGCCHYSVLLVRRRCGRRKGKGELEPLAAETTDTYAGDDIENSRPSHSRSLSRRPSSQSLLTTAAAFNYHDDLELVQLHRHQITPPPPPPPPPAAVNKNSPNTKRDKLTD